MKKFTVLLLVLLFGFSSVLVACAPEEAAEGDLRAAIIFNGPVSDGGWNAECYQGMQNIKEEHGFEISYSENVSQADFVSAFREYADQGYDLIVGPGAEYSDAVEEIYADYPDTKFAVINGGFIDDNVTSMSHDNVQAGFLAGVIAGLHTETNAVGYVGGTEIVPIVDAERGMENGLEYVNPEAEYVSTMAGSWDDMALGREIGESMITTRNVDVIFGFASAVNAGILEACQEHDAYMVAQPGDLLDQAPETYLTSVIISNPRIIGMAGAMVAEDNWESEFLVGNLSNGGVDIGRYSDVFSEENREELERIVDAIMAGEIDVEKGAQ